MTQPSGAIGASAVHVVASRVPETIAGLPSHWYSPASGSGVDNAPYFARTTDLSVAIHESSEFVENVANIRLLSLRMTSVMSCAFVIAAHALGCMYSIGFSVTLWLTAKICPGSILVASRLNALVRFAASTTIEILSAKADIPESTEPKRMRVLRFLRVLIASRVVSP